MSVWVCVPSARPSAEALAWVELWQSRGYKVALYRDQYDEALAAAVDHFATGPDYPGYAKATNYLIQQVMTLDDTAGWFVIGGDDVEPDRQKRANEISAECYLHFASTLRPTFAVMQPTGDRWGDGRGAYIDRVAGSPWIGREFAKRMYGGDGPLFPDYKHMFVDEELWHVARNLGVYWSRPDLTHLHQHWGRRDRGADANDIPPHLKRWNTAEHWRESRELFQARQAAGFPGHEPK